MSDAYRALIACLWGGLILAGCNKPDERLQALNGRIKALDGQMRLGEVREIPLPSIRQGEWLVVINGQYGGVVCPPSPLSEKVARQAILDFGNKEGGASAYMLLVSDDSIQSSVGSSINFTVWQPEKFKGSCALIAGPSHVALVVECVRPVVDKASGRTCDITLRAVK